LTAYILLRENIVNHNILIIDKKRENDYTEPMKKQETKGTALAILGAFITAVFIKIFFFDFMIAEGSSMEPSIKSGSVLMVGKFAYGFKIPWMESYLIEWAEPRIGDVVVFYTPLGVTAVKRCAGITENREFIAKGDNQSVSFDSGSYGPVPIHCIIGKALWIK
jgi:signal peptidase I